MELEEVGRTLDSVTERGFRSRATHAYGTIRRMVRDRVCFREARILDFGCGEGIAAVAFALRLPGATVFGSDIIPPQIPLLKDKLTRLTGLEVPANLTIFDTTEGTLPGHVVDLDLVYAWSVFEHIEFSCLTHNMALIRSRLAPGGIFALQINPLFFSPRGAHLYRYYSEPWAHLLYQTDVLRQLIMASPLPERRKRRGWEQYETLNRATADDILDAARAAGFKIAEEKRFETTLDPPERLLSAYTGKALITEEIRLVLA